MNYADFKARKLVVKRAVEYLDKLAAESEGNENLQSELATAYEKIGDVQAEIFSFGIGDTAGALENHRKSLKIRENLANKSPNNLQFQVDLTISLQKIADLSVTIGNMPSALENYQKAIETIEKVNQKNPDDSEINFQLAKSCAKLGQGILRSGSISKSLENFEKALAIMQKLSEENPSNLKFHHNVSVFKQYAAYAKLEMGKEIEAL